MWRRIAGIVLVLGISVGACAYRGEDDPVSRKFTWFSYMNADDLRSRCVQGAPPAYRFIYNGIYIKQVRTYDIRANEVTAAYTLKARVIGPTDLSAVTIDPSALTSDPLSVLPGRGVIQNVPLSGRDLDQLDGALAASGFFRPAPAGLTLISEDFFWLGAACIGGRFWFNAVKWPSSQFKNATFPAILLQWDPTGIPINPPRDLSNFDIYGDMRADESPRYRVTIGDNNALIGVGTLF